MNTYEILADIRTNERYTEVQDIICPSSGEPKIVVEIWRWDCTGRIYVGCGSARTFNKALRIAHKRWIERGKC